MAVELKPKPPDSNPFFPDLLFETSYLTFSGSDLLIETLDRTFSGSGLHFPGWYSPASAFKEDGLVIDAFDFPGKLALETHRFSLEPVWAEPFEGMSARVEPMAEPLLDPLAMAFGALVVGLLVVGPTRGDNTFVGLSDCGGLDVWADPYVIGPPVGFGPRTWADPSTDGLSFPDPFWTMTSGLMENQMWASVRGQPMEYQSLAIVFEHPIERIGTSSCPKSVVGEPKGLVSATGHFKVVPWKPPDVELIAGVLVSVLFSIALFFRTLPQSFSSNQHRLPKTPIPHVTQRRALRDLVDSVPPPLMVYVWTVPQSHLDVWDLLPFIGSGNGVEG